MKYDLLIQIINYNTKKYLQVCLNSLFADLEDCGINYHVAVLDNNSNDDLSETEKMYRGKRISFHRSDVNLGFGGGHNHISKLFESEFMLILNSDIKFLGRNTVGHLFDKLKSAKEFAVIGPRLVEEDMKPQQFDHGELKGIMSAIKNNYGSSYWKLRNSPLEAAWVSGAVFMVRSDVFKKADGFDEKFFLYKEEEDLCKRIRDAGRKILYDPTVSVMHFGHVVAKRSEYFSDSMNYYIDKHFRRNLSYKILNTIKIFKDLTLYRKIQERK